MKMKSYGKLLAALFACMAVVAVLLVQSCAAIADEGYIMVSGTKYATSEDIAKVCNPAGGVVKDGSTIEIYGKVKVPFTLKTSPAPLGEQEAFFSLSHDNVIVEGKTEDALIYTDEAVPNGALGTQDTIVVFGSGVIFKKLTIMPKFDSDGNTNKTLEVYGDNFEINNCQFVPNTYYSSGDVKETVAGGSLLFNGAKENITVTDSTFKNCYVVFCDTDPAGVITISGNTFDSPQGDTYFIGNNTWANPPSEKMGPVYVENNIFKNLPADYKKVVYHRMEGTFYLKGNKIESSQGSDKLLDRVSFGRLYGTHPTEGKDCASGGKAVNMLSEGGRNNKITAKLSD